MPMAELLNWLLDHSPLPQFQKNLACDWEVIRQFLDVIPRLQSVNPIQPGLFGVKTVVAYSTLKMRNLKTISPFLRGEREIWISFLEKRKRNQTKFSQLSKREKYCSVLNFESKKKSLKHLSTISRGEREYWRRRRKSLNVESRMSHK